MSAIEGMLATAREGLQRVAPEELAAAMADGAIVVDIRPERDRTTDGELPGAIVLERNVLEWRLDPTSPDAIPEAGAARRVILFCNEGYASSLAVRTLRELGLSRATDLEDGYRAWRALLNPVEAADDRATGGSSAAK